jgi:poly(A) polymerase
MNRGRTFDDILASGNFRTRLYSFSALDNYMGLPSLPFVMAETSGDITGLARLFEDLRYPGADIADASAEDEQGRTWYFRCRDGEEFLHNGSYSPYQMLSLTQNLEDRRFWDPLGIYSQIRNMRETWEKQKKLQRVSLVFPAGERGSAVRGGEEREKMPWWGAILPGAPYFRILADGALILARYRAAEMPPPDFTEIIASVCGERDAPPLPEAQRLLLRGLLASPYPGRGFEFLRRAGFVKKFWPSLAALNNVDHSKEFHPEGNVWKHTMEALGHRKCGPAGAYDMLLSLGILLHDLGKPLAGSAGNRRFDGHAELGAHLARRFLEHLEFGASVTDGVYYLVKNHMLPAALNRLPLMRTGDVMNSPLFPVLLELYRCDEASSFKGLENNYENSAAYRSYLRNIRNPYRSADGKKMKGRTGR